MEESIPLAPSLYFLPGENQGRFPFSNSLLVEGETRALIDTGAGRILQAYSSRNTDVVIVSHFHPDHVLDKERFLGVSFWSHPAETPPLLSRQGFCQYTGLDSMGPDWESLYPLSLSFLPEIHYHFHDGEDLDFGGIRLKAIHLPGHSPGHTGFFHEKTGVLYSSDIDLSRFGPWYGYPSSDIGTFLEAIDRIKEMKPRLVVSGHKGVMEEDLGKKLQEYQRVVFSREERILSCLNIPRTRRELLQECFIYGELSLQVPLLAYFEEIFLDKHLDFLFYRGGIKKEGDYYVRV